MDLRTVYLPYVLVKLNSGKWIFLNRYYKPLGLYTKEWIDYESHFSIFSFSLSSISQHLSKLCETEKDDKQGTYFWLYDDGCHPYLDNKSTEIYFKKLEKIMKYKTK